MSKSINKVILFGRVGKDPESTTFQDGSKVVSFTLATSEGGYKNKNGKDIPEVTQWHRVKVFGSSADVAEKYIRKGSSITVIGKIKYTEVEKDGKKSYFTDIIVSELFLHSKAEGQESSSPQPVQEPETKADDLPF